RAWHTSAVVQHREHAVVPAFPDGQTSAIAWLAQEATAPCCSYQQMKTPPASEDANGVFHAFTSLKVAALERKTSKRRLRSSRIRIFCGSARASRPECRPGFAQRPRIIFLALPFEYLLRFLETRHACRNFGSL